MKEEFSEDLLASSSEEFSEDLLASSSEEFSEELTFDDEPEKSSTSKKRKQDDFRASKPKIALTQERREELKALAKEGLVDVLNRSDGIERPTIGGFTDILYKGIENKEEAEYLAAIMLRSLARRKIYLLPDVESTPVYGLWKAAWTFLGVTGTTRVMVPQFYKLINAVGKYYSKQISIKPPSPAVIEWKALSGIMQMLGNIAVKIYDGNEMKLLVSANNYMGRKLKKDYRRRVPVATKQYPLSAASVKIECPKQIGRTVYKFIFMYTKSKVLTYVFQFSNETSIKIVLGGSGGEVTFVNPKESRPEYSSMVIPYSSNARSDYRGLVWSDVFQSDLGGHFDDTGYLTLRFNYNVNKPFSTQVRDLFLTLLMNLKVDMPFPTHRFDIKSLSINRQVSALLRPSVLMYLIMTACADRTAESYTVYNMVGQRSDDWTITPSRLFFKLKGKDNPRARIYRESTRIFSNTELFHSIRKAIGYFKKSKFGFYPPKKMIDRAKIAMKPQKNLNEILKGEVTPWQTITQSISKMRI